MSERAVVGWPAACQPDGESFACGKDVNFAVAADFLKSQVGESFTPYQLAELSHVAIAIQTLELEALAKRKLSSAQIKAHCNDEVPGAFGPSGNVIKGLLR